MYEIDPWGDQRADMRMSQIAWAAMAPHVKGQIKANDFMLFPEGGGHDLGQEEEAEIERKLGRLAKVG